jgi:hypothetical protein
MGEPSPNRRLDSWKEIAAYLRRDLRTVTRWAKQRGLPVHHVPGPGRTAVFAWTEEIDAWLLQQGNGPVEPAARTPWLRRPVVLAVAATAVVVLVAVVVILTGGRAPAEPPLEVRLLTSGVEALGRDGRLLWRYEFPQPIRTFSPERFEELGRLARLTDLDGDGQPEVIVVADFVTSVAGREPPHSILFCFSADGRLLWQWKAEMTLRFAGREFTGPWYFWDLVTAPPGAPGAVWVAVVHNHWWPSVVARIDAAGRGDVIFHNSGHIYALNYLQTLKGDFVLAGGFNNDYEMASLAVLSAEGTSGSSPQNPDSSYRALDPPAGSPNSYFLFPRSELSLLERTQMMNRVLSVAIGVEEVTVAVWEGYEPASALYQFHRAPEFGLAYADYSDGYWRLHRVFEEEGRLDHTVEECRRRVHPLPVREWRDGSWHTLRVPSQYAAP